jgi:hypothetical protein
MTNYTDNERITISKAMLSSREREEIKISMNTNSLDRANT